jgi:cytidylate kinase
MGEPAAAAGASDSLSDRRNVCATIAVDGSAASGKSTVGRRLAVELGYPFLDTGIMYRALTAAALQRNLDLSDERQLGRLATSIEMKVELGDPATDRNSRVVVDGTDLTAQIRSEEVEDAVSLVSQIQPVREAMVTLQRKIAGLQPIVMAGRDIGTVVLPSADLKIYLDASPEVRARRRHQEFEALGRDASRSAVHDDLTRRDQIDSQRAISPLRPADDAFVISTDGLSVDEVLNAAIALVRKGAGP